MATAISGSLQASGPKRTASFFHELPEFLHLGNAFDGQTDDFGVGFYAESFFRSAQRAFIDKIGFALQFSSWRHLRLQFLKEVRAHIIRANSLRIKVIFFSVGSMSRKKLWTRIAYPNSGAALNFNSTGTPRFDMCSRSRRCPMGKFFRKAQRELGSK